MWPEVTTPHGPLEVAPPAPIGQTRLFGVHPGAASGPGQSLIAATLREDVDAAELACVVAAAAREQSVPERPEQGRRPRRYSWASPPTRRCPAVAPPRRAAPRAGAAGPEAGGHRPSPAAHPARGREAPISSVSSSSSSAAASAASAASRPVRRAQASTARRTARSASACAPAIRSSPCGSPRGAAGGHRPGQQRRRARGTPYVVVGVGTCLTYAYEQAAVESHVIDGMRQAQR